MRMPVETKAAELRKVVRDAIDCRREAIRYTLARQLHELLKSKANPLLVSRTSEDTSWTRIESLSQLRAVVGGRFQNLKSRWINAGFPLREHRGDRALDAAVNYEGWVELAAWISKQGYEVRLAGEGESFLFEVKRLD